MRQLLHSHLIIMYKSLHLQNESTRFYQSIVITDRLRDGIQILDVANRLGILEKYNIQKAGNSYLGDCPTGHGSENHKCFGLNTEGNYFHCFHCNHAGDVISLVQLVQQVEYKQALLWLAENFQPDLVPEVQHLTPERTAEEDELYKKHILYEETYKHGNALLDTKAGKAALDALLARGYKIEHLKQ